jgi:hypothetical protein
MSLNNLKSQIFLSLIILFSYSSLKAQATTSVVSSDGYTVNVSFTPKRIIAPGNCDWGYNYNTEIDYIISFSGSNIPSSLYTLQVIMNCNNQANFSSLPLNGGTGVATTSSNPYTNATNCNTATVATMNCNSFNLIIEGPGISHRNIALTYTFPLPDQIGLPVKYSSLGVITKLNSNEIYWTTSYEQNNELFTVERSIDGFDWTEISSVKPGLSELVRSYSVIDSKPINGMNLYRIKQKDIDGKINYSNIIYNHFKASFNVKLFPNPSVNYFKIESDNVNDMTFQMINTLGQTIDLKSVIENNVITFDISNLNSGIYVIKINFNGVIENHTLKVSK